MKRLSTLFAAITLLLASGCSKYDDSSLWNSVTSLEERVYQLEQLCNQMNTNISSLQTIVTALQTNDCITGITPVTEKGKEIGYTITFTQSSPITIYHGKEGEKGETGATGQNGHTPVIGAKQDTDGFYYWTLDGEWLTDGDNKIKAQGDAGPEGEPGITPQLKIENNYWEVSYDNGRSWTQLGKATGESSDSIFKRIDYTTSSDYVVFELFDGTTLQLPKISELAIDLGVNSLAFQIDETQTVSYLIKGGSADNVIKAELLNDDGGYTLRTVPESATRGKIEISAKIPTDNRVIISVSDGSHTIMTAIDVSIAPSFDGKTVTVAAPGTLMNVLISSEYDLSTITELTIIGSLNSSDRYALLGFPNLSVLDMENANMERETLYEDFFYNFYGGNFDKLTTIVLPKTLKEIGDDAFSGCSSLTNITIPSSVTTIGWQAFSCCSSLTNVTIPNGVTTIRRGTFIGCSSLTDITIPGSVTTIGDYAFSGCSSLTNITIPSSVTAIGDYAFSRCSSLTDITIPGSVTAIGEWAFYSCSSLTDITIPGSVTAIGEWAFYSCSSLTNVTIQSGVTAIGDSAFYNCTGLANVTIPSSVTAIGDSAFSGCSSLTNVTIPNGVTTIGDSAFSGCSSLTNVTIPNGVTTIGDSAFSGCSALTDITISSSVTAIGEWAFQGTDIQQVYCKATTPPLINSNSFPDGIVIYVPTGCADAYRTAPGWSGTTTFNEIIETEFNEL